MLLSQPQPRADAVTVMLDGLPHLVVQRQLPHVPGDVVNAPQERAGIDQRPQPGDGQAGAALSSQRCSPTVTRTPSSTGAMPTLSAERAAPHQCSRVAICTITCPSCPLTFWGIRWPWLKRDTSASATPSGSMSPRCVRCSNYHSISASSSSPSRFPKQMSAMLSST